MMHIPVRRVWARKPWRKADCRKRNLPSGTCVKAWQLDEDKALMSSPVIRLATGSRWTSLRQTDVVPILAAFVCTENMSRLRALHHVTVVYYFIWDCFGFKNKHQSPPLPPMPHHVLDRASRARFSCFKSKGRRRLEIPGRVPHILGPMQEGTAPETGK